MTRPNLLLLPLLLFSSACHHHDHHHHHDEEDVMLLYTSYGQAIELFVESTPFAIDEEAGLTLHLTALNDFKPISEAEISLFWHDDPHQKIRSVAVSPGIYSASIIPTKGGLSTLVFAIDWSGTSEQHEWEVQVFATLEQAEEAAHQLEADYPNAVVFTKGYSWGIDFATVELSKTRFGELIKTVGLINPSPQDERVVGVRTSGILNFVSDLYPGTRINEGQLLATVNPDGFSDGNLALQFTEARNNFERLRSEYERAKQLFEQQIKSEKEYLQARNEFYNAKAVFENFQTVFHESGEQVKSPMNGFVKQLVAENGQHISSGQPLVLLSNFERFSLRADVPARYSKALQHIESANVVHMGKVYSLEQLGGRLVSIGNRLSVQNQLIPIVFEINNIDQILPGMPVDLYIRAALDHDVLVVPGTAVTEESGAYFAYVQIHPELFEKRQIRLGATDGLNYEIADGLVAGERIVSRGAVLVKAAAAVSQLDPHAGHVH